VLLYVFYFKAVFRLSVYNNTDIEHFVF